MAVWQRKRIRLPSFTCNKRLPTLGMRSATSGLRAQGLKDHGSASSAWTLPSVVRLAA